MSFWGSLFSRIAAALRWAERRNLANFDTVSASIHPPCEQNRRLSLYGARRREARVSSQASNRPSCRSGGKGNRNGVADEKNFLLREMNPAGAGCGGRSVVQDHRRRIPVDGHRSVEGHGGARPAQRQWIQPVGSGFQHAQQRAVLERILEGFHRVGGLLVGQKRGRLAFENGSQVGRGKRAVGRGVHLHDEGNRAAFFQQPPLPGFGFRRKQRGIQAENSARSRDGGDRMSAAVGFDKDVGGKSGHAFSGKGG